MRGEHCRGATRPTRPTGPSPRARGALGVAELVDVQPGTIPACAGSTVWSHSDNTAAGDHPRVRGEHGTRGAQHVTAAWTIPACAGSTRRPPRSARGQGDHPRVRGEHGILAGALLLAVGPSPRARGARGGGPCAGARVGTIPACAGSTPAPSTTGSSSRDHPRVRGEHESGGGAGGAQAGPSPRARGAPLTSALRPVDRGTIPACAGSTLIAGLDLSGGGDHPRVRGEHSPTRIQGRGLLGPSPRARGAPDGALRRVVGRGTIPACAGSTLRCRAGPRS